jgi:hypothetical protein
MIIDKSTVDALLCGDNAFMNTALMLNVGEFIRIINFDV